MIILQNLVHGAQSITHTDQLGDYWNVEGDDWKGDGSFRFSCDECEVDGQAVDIDRMHVEEVHSLIEKGNINPESINQTDVVFYFQLSDDPDHSDLTGMSMNEMSILINADLKNA